MNLPLIIGVALGGYFFYSKKKEETAKKAEQAKAAAKTSFENMTYEELEKWIKSNITSIYLDLAKEVLKTKTPTKPETTIPDSTYIPTIADKVIFSYGYILFQDYAPNSNRLFIMVEADVWNNNNVNVRLKDIQFRLRVDNISFNYAVFKTNKLYDLVPGLNSIRLFCNFNVDVFPSNYDYSTKLWNHIKEIKEYNKETTGAAYEDYSARLIKLADNESRIFIDSFKVSSEGVTTMYEEQKKLQTIRATAKFSEFTNRQYVAFKPYTGTVENVEWS